LSPRRQPPRRALVIPVAAAHALDGMNESLATEPVRRRLDMVERQLAARGIADEAVLQAMRTVPRHLFVPPELGPRAYDDEALMLGPGQSISQPYIVALMTELARPRAGERALEIGTGSGYQAAVLAEIVNEVWSIERDPALAAAAQETLRRLCYRNVHVRAGDGKDGWPEAAPFDLILVTAATEAIPPAWREQLAVAGRMVVPIGAADARQTLRRYEKQPDGRLREENVTSVRFVPFVSG
jgi:protein-L-isoaspartate(D-aspartate) O-methyltransferase